MLHLFRHSFDHGKRGGRPAVASSATVSRPFWPLRSAVEPSTDTSNTELHADGFHTRAAFSVVASPKMLSCKHAQQVLQQRQAVAKAHVQCHPRMTVRARVSHIAKAPVGPAANGNGEGP